MTDLVLLGAIVFSFRIYQNMTALQEERAEKIILENNGLDNAIEACMKMREKQPDAEAYT